MQRTILQHWEKEPTGEGKVVELKGFTEGAGVRSMTRCEILKLTTDMEDNLPVSSTLAVCFYSAEGQFTTGLEEYTDVLKSVFGFQLE